MTPEQFSREEKRARWVASVADDDYDLAVPDEDGRPMARALALLDHALPEVDHLVDASVKYLAAFCSVESSGLNSPYTLVELSVGAIRSELGVYVFLNFDKDTYGHWSVGFVHLQLKHWSASCFGRESW